MHFHSYNQAAAVSKFELECKEADSSNESSDDMLYCFLDNPDLEEHKKEVETIKAKMKQYEEVNRLKAAMNRAEARHDEKVKELEDKIKELHAELCQLKETGKKLSLNDDYIYFGAICHKIQDQIMEAMTRDLHLSEEQYEEITGYGIWKIMQLHKDKHLEDYFTDSVHVDIDHFKSNVSKVMTQMKLWHKGKLLHFKAPRNEAAHPEVDIRIDEIVERIEKSAMEAKDIGVAKSILNIVRSLQCNHII